MAKVDDVLVPINLIVQRDGAAWDISTATNIDIRGLKPSGESFVLNAVFTTTAYDPDYTGSSDGTDGAISAYTTSGDLDEEGWYFFDPLVEFSGNGLYRQGDTIQEHIYRGVA